MMNIQSKILIGFVLIAMAVSIWFTYQRSFVKHDFTLITSLNHSLYV